MNIALIIARAGSKRLKNKSIKIFFGRPIISYSIKTAINSKIFNKVIVSTESKKISSISKKFGAEVPFARPKKFSKDSVGIFPVINHAIQKLKLKNKDNLCCIFPISPNVKKKLIADTLKILKKKKSDFVFPVIRVFNKEKPLHINKSGFIRKTKIKENSFRADPGQFYWGRVSAFKKYQNIFKGKSLGHLVSSKKYIDVNYSGDWNKLKKNFKQ